EPRHGDALEAPVHQHRRLFPEHLDAADVVTELHDDDAVAGLLDLRDARGGDVRGVQSVERRQPPEMSPGFGSRIVWPSGALRPLADVGRRRPYERRNTEPIVEVNLLAGSHQTSLRFAENRGSVPGGRCEGVDG